MATLIYNVTDLQNMKNDLAGAYELANNIDASGTATWNPTIDRGEWLQSTGYEIRDYVRTDGTRKICKREYNVNGTGSTVHEITSFGLVATSTPWKLKTFRFPLWYYTPVDGVRISLWTADSDYIPLAELEAYYIEDITDHVYFSKYNIYIHDVWLTLPEAFEFDIEADTRYAVVLEIDSPSGSWVLSYATSLTPTYPPNLPTSATGSYGKAWVKSEDTWYEYSYKKPNITIYPGGYYLCQTAHTSQTYLSDDSAKWQSYGDTEPPPYLGFEPIGQDSPYFTGDLDGKNYSISNLFINRPGEDDVGLFGVTLGATIEDVSLSAVSITGDDDVGGLVGCSQETAISGCSVTGTVAGSDDYVGGLIGLDYQTTLNKCSSTADISGDDYLGSLIGYSYDSAITNVYARGDVTGDRYIGGLIGINYSSVDDAYSTGAVTGNTYVGGLISSNGGTVTTSYWDTETSGQATSDGGTGKTTAEMKEMLTFLAWDIGATATDRNEGYPFLSWEIDESATVWLIYGTGISPPYTTPDIYDWKGRVAKGARIQAYRTDTHAWVATETINQYGNATFTELPNDVDIRFIVNWGGTAQDHKSRTFTRRVEQVTDGGTGYSTAENARSNLGIGATISIWNLILGE